MEKLTRDNKPENGRLCLVKVYYIFANSKFNEVYKAIHLDDGWYIWNTNIYATTEAAEHLNESLYTVTHWTYFDLKEPTREEIMEAEMAYYD